MNFDLNVIIPMAGLGKRFTDYGFKTKKYLLPINENKTIISEAIKTLNISYYKKVRYIFILLNDDEKTRNELSKIMKDYEIIITDKLLNGSVCSVMLAENFINNDIPLLISNCDQILSDIKPDFYEKCSNYDGLVMTYDPEYQIGPVGSIDKHSFIQLSPENNHAIKITEKIVLPDSKVLVGVHYYKKGKYFIDSVKYLFDNEVKAPNGEYYISLTYNYLIKEGLKVSNYHLSENEKFYPVGTPEDYFNYLNYNTYRGNIKNKKLSDFIKISEIDVSFDYMDANISIFLDEFLIKKGDEKNGDIYIKLNDEINVETSIKNYFRGWIIGNFSPSIYKTEKYELGILRHEKDEKWDIHYHEKTKEINILIKGNMTINEKLKLSRGDIFVFEKMEISSPKFITDCIVLCIKIPSIPGDKIIL